MKAVATFVGATRQRSRTDGRASVCGPHVTYEGGAIVAPATFVNWVSTRTESRSGSEADTTNDIERPGTTSKRVPSAGADHSGARFGPEAVVEVGDAGAGSSVVTRAISPTEPSTTVITTAAKTVLRIGPTGRRRVPAHRGDRTAARRRSGHWLTALQSHDGPHGHATRAGDHPGDRHGAGQGLLRRPGRLPRRPRPPGQRTAALRAAHPAGVSLLDRLRRGHRRGRAWLGQGAADGGGRRGCHPRGAAGPGRRGH